MSPRRVQRRPRRRGYTLIEQMIAVAILGIVSTLAGVGAYWQLSAPGRPGHAALRTEAATSELVRAQQESLLEPFGELAAQAGEAPRALPSELPSVRLERQVTRIGDGLLRIDLTAWVRVLRGERPLRLVALRGEGR